MSDDLTPLPSGSASLGGIEFDEVAFLGRIGDGLTYSARLDGQAVRLREYAPAGIVRRRADHGLEPTDEKYAAAWTDGQARFLAQARELAALRHPAFPRIVHAFASEEADRGAFLVTRPVDPPLASALGAAPALAPEQIMRIAGELADALALLHARGLTHLDLAPETVSVASGPVELADFAIDNRAFIALLGRQEGLVRPGYSPIERSDATAAEPLGPATDVYAASALLYRLIEGRDPAPWEERWRDPAASALPDRDPYPPAFLAALRKGMAIEPGDRFGDAESWRAAMQLAGAAPPAMSLNKAPPPTYPPSSYPPAAPPPMPTANWLVPLLIALIVIALAGLGYIAYAHGWFDRPEEPVANTVLPAPVPTPLPTPAPVEPGPPALTIGSSVAGRLSASDTRTGAGQYADSYVIDARGGERLEIRLSSSDFDPVLRISGPGLSTSNDDDAESGGLNSRLEVTLPRAGRYTITATTYDRDETGAYLLEVSAARPDLVKPDDVTTVDLSSAARLSGRWRAEDDPDCANPAVNVVAGDRLISRVGGQVHTHRIVATDGDIVRTEATEGRAAGRAFAFRFAPDGEAYEVEGETWLRCRT